MENSLEAQKVETTFYYGFGGWMYFLVITQLYSVFVTSTGIGNWMNYISSDDISILRTNGYSDYADRFAVLGVLGLLYSTFLIGIILASWFFLLRVSRFYKTTNIILIIGNFSGSAILACFMYYLNYYTGEEIFFSNDLIIILVSPITFGAIWLPYFLKSKRIANTFNR